jgi:hypothetical protein
VEKDDKAEPGQQASGIRDAAVRYRPLVREKNGRKVVSDDTPHEK